MLASEDTLNQPLPIIATIDGEPYTESPQDLFIPPDALEVLLDSFTGPLDLLLYLIRRQNIDIMDIPILKITRQYMEYIDLMEQHRLELAADYLVMAAVLAEIKSRLLLPLTPTQQEGVEDDPRMALVRRLQVYEQYKQAATMIDSLTRSERDVFPIHITAASLNIIKPQPDVDLFVLIDAMRSLLIDRGLSVSHAIQRELLSVRDRMVQLLQRIHAENYLEFTHLYCREEGRMGLVVSLLAILELAKQSLLIVTQASAYSPIYLSLEKAAESTTSNAHHDSIAFSRLKANLDG